MTATSYVDLPALMRIRSLELRARLVMEGFWKGLHRSPKIVTDPIAMWHHSVLTAADISCLVIPDGCLGLPTLAALEQGIKVIAVRENINLMRNDLSALPWAAGQFYCVDNYWEAVGVMTAIKAGVKPGSVRRPILETEIVKKRANAKSHSLVK